MIIGITTTYEEDHGYERANVEYLERIAQAGGTPVLLPPAPGGDEAAIAAAREVATRIDGLVLSGGGDIDPALYEEARLPETVNVVHTRDIYEMALARYAHELDLPVLGICRGMQVLNLTLGGTIYQDLSLRNRNSFNHIQRSLDRSDPCHTVAFASHSLLYEICGNSCAVNSYHHQCVKTLGKHIKMTGITSDGVIESIESTGHTFAVGVQWHPECMYTNCEAMRRLFDQFVRKAASAKHLSLPLSASLKL